VSCNIITVSRKFYKKYGINVCVCACSVIEREGGGGVHRIKIKMYGKKTSDFTAVESDRVQ
jgi:hypothetical protein